MALSEKQKRFADEYLKTLNATDAYKKAGYKSKSGTAIRANASRLIANDNVSKYLQARLKQHKLDDYMSQTEVLNRLSEIASGMSQKMVYKHYDKLKKRTTSESETSKTPELPDQLAALQMLGKFHKLFVDKAEVELTTPTFVDDVPGGDDNADSQASED